MNFRELLNRYLVSKEANKIVNRMPTTVGSFGFDPWGFNADTLKLGLSLFKVIYEKYFRVEAFGLENIPADGRLLVIANHGGQLPVDGALVAYALATNPHSPRATRAMIERWFPSAPYVGNLINEFGAVLGDPENCIKMLNNEECIIVFPEGVRGAGKPWKDRYKLQRFGKGFMYLAITEKTPIIPVAIVGCEETMPTPFHLNSLARFLNVPYIPVTTPVPLPTKVRLYFGEPMMFEGPVNSEDDVAIKVEKVKEAIEKQISEGLTQRRGWFS